MDFLTELRKICIKTLVAMLSVNPLAAEPFLIREVDRVMNWARPEYATHILALLEAELPEGGSLDNFPRCNSSATNLQRTAPVMVRRTGLTNSSEAPAATLASEKSRYRILGDIIRQINYLREYSDVITRRSQLSGMLAINNLRVSCRPRST